MACWTSHGLRQAQNLVHLPYCPFPDFKEHEQGVWQDLHCDRTWVVSPECDAGLEGVGVAERSRVCRVSEDPGIDLDLYRQEVTSAREVTEL